MNEKWIESLPNVFKNHTNDFWTNCGHMVWFSCRSVSWNGVKDIKKKPMPCQLPCIKVIFQNYLSALL